MKSIERLAIFVCLMEVIRWGLPFFSYQLVGYYEEIFGMPEQMAYYWGGSRTTIVYVAVP